MDNNISIARLETYNYRNLANDKAIELNNLNILIGSNGSGKSSLIALLEFLKSCLMPSADLDSRGITAFQNALADKLRNNLLKITLKKPSHLIFDFKFPSFELDKILGLYFSLCVNQDDSIYIAEEMFFEYEKTTTGHNKFYARFSGNAGITLINYRNKNLENIPTNELALITIPKLLTEQGEFSPEQVPLYKAQRELIDNIKKWQFYNANEMDLAKIRNASPRIELSDAILSKSCDNLSTVLNNLMRHEKYGLEFEDIINHAMKEILPATKRIRSTYNNKSILIQWYFHGIDSPFYLDDMSDGTVRMLCWAVILHSPILPTLLIIDEPELSLHIAWMGILANWIKQASQKTQVIITTHSPDLLDYFTDCVDKVICFEKTSDNYFQANSLNQTNLQDKITEGWQLGDLYRIGDDTIGGWPW